MEGVVINGPDYGTSSKPGLAPEDNSAGIARTSGLRVFKAAGFSSPLSFRAVSVEGFFMTSIPVTPSPLSVAISAARAAGDLIRSQFGRPLDVAEMFAHDIKLDLDVKSQELITSALLAAFPHHAIYGEEGLAGDQTSDWQWIVDPIDGTVNFFYSIPHFCVSIALRHKGEIVLGVIYDPMRDELWEVERGGAPKLNGKVFSVSQRTKLSDAVVSVACRSPPMWRNRLLCFWKSMCIALASAA